MTEISVQYHIYKGYDTATIVKSYNDKLNNNPDGRKENCIIDR